MTIFNLLIILCVIGWSLVIIPILWRIIDILRDRYVIVNGYSPVGTDEMELPPDENELSVLKHFRNAVS